MWHNAKTVGNIIFYMAIGAGTIIPYYNKSVIMKDCVGISMQRKGRVLHEGFNFRIPFYEVFRQVAKKNDAVGMGVWEFEHDGARYAIKIDDFTITLSEMHGTLSLYDKIKNMVDSEYVINDWMNKLGDDALHKLVEYHNHPHLDLFVSNDISEISQKEGWIVAAKNVSLWKPLE